MHLSLHDEVPVTDDPFHPPQTESRRDHHPVPVGDIAVAGLGVSMLALIASAIVAPAWPATPLAVVAVASLVVLAVWRAVWRR